MSQSEPGFDTVDREDLAARLEQTSPENEHRSRGFALVNVLGPETFEQQRIPGSTNIPASRVEEFEERFDKEKEIIVYCSSSECDASEKAARELTHRGFQRVVEYPDGLRAWREAGHPLAGSGSLPGPDEEPRTQKPG